MRLPFLQLRRTATTRALALLLPLALVAAACGNDNASDDRDDGRSDDTDRTRDDGEQRDEELDQAIAEAGLLVLSDFPSGWEEQAAEDDDDDDQILEEIADCMDVGIEEISGGVVMAESPTFVSAAEDEVANSVSVMVTEEQMAERFEVRTSQDYLDCFVPALDRSLARDAPRGVSYDTPTINKISFDSFGDESAAYRVTIGVEADGFSVDAYLDVVMVRVGRAAMIVNATSVFSPFYSDDLADYTEVAVGRLARALEDEQPGDADESAADASDGDDDDGPADPAVEPQGSLSSPYLQGSMDADLPAGNPGEVSVVAVGPVESSTAVVVRNNTDERVTISLSGTARDADGALVGSGQDQGIEPTYVEPGQLAIGYVYLGFDDPPPGSTVEVTARGERPDRRFGKLPLQVIEYNRTAGEFGMQEIIGLLRNDHEQTVDGPVSVLVMCFDADGTPTTTGSGFVDQDDLPAGAEASFSVTIYDGPACDRYLIGASGYSF